MKHPESIKNPCDADYENGFDANDPHCILFSTDNPRHPFAAHGQFKKELNTLLPRQKDKTVTHINCWVGGIFNMQVFKPSEIPFSVFTSIQGHFAKVVVRKNKNKKKQNTLVFVSIVILT